MLDRRSVAIGVAIVAIVTGCAGDEGEAPAEGLPTEPFVLDVSVGDCFDRPQSPDVTKVPTVDCDEPHDFEAYAILELEGDSYPGEEQLAAEAAALCREPFAGYVGVPASDSGLVIVPVTPTLENWERDERTVTCTVTVRAEEPLQGSVENSEQPAG